MDNDKFKRLKNIIVWYLSFYYNVFSGKIHKWNIFQQYWKQHDLLEEEISSKRKFWILKIFDFWNLTKKYWNIIAYCVSNYT